MVIKFCHPLCAIVLYQLPCISLFVCMLSLYLVISPTVSFVSCICFVLLCLLVKSVVSPSECPNLSLCAVTSCFICSLCSLVFCIEFCFLCLVNYYWVHLCSHVPPLPLVTCFCIYLLSPFISCQTNILLFFCVFFSCSAPSVSSQFSFCICFLVALCFLCCCLSFVMARFLLISACLRVCIWSLFSTTRNLRPADYNNNV